MRSKPIIVICVLAASPYVACAELGGLRTYLLMPGPAAGVRADALAEAGVDALVLRHDPSALPRGIPLSWVLKAAGVQPLGALNIDAPLLDAEGNDLLAENPDWRAQSADGSGALAGVPCFAYAGMRAAKLAEAEASLDLGPDGLLVMATPPAPVSEGEHVARGFGYNQPVVEAYRRKYGSDPREAVPGSLEQLLFVDLKAKLLTEFFAELRAKVGDKPVYLAMQPEDMAAETARHRYLDLHELLGRGLVDGVFLATAQAMELRRVRLHTDREIRVGLLGRDDPVATMLAALRSPGCGDVMLCVPEGTSPVEVLARVTQAVEAQREQEASRAALEAAIEAGELFVATGVDPEGHAVNQATIHGVAQSFRLEQAAQVEAVGLFCALRGPAALSMVDLPVRVCADAGGAPDLERVLAEFAIPAVSFGREPRYQWGYARLEPPLGLEAGRTYWLHAPNASGPEGSYVWRVVPDGSAYPHGHAWSSKYEYAEYDWAFRLLSRK